MTMSTPKANTNTSPAPRRWQTQPVPGSHHVLGYLMTKSMTRPFCDKYCPLPEDASEREEEIHFRSMRSYLPQLLPPEYGLENLESVLVYVDKKRMSMARAFVLADNRGRLPEQRVPPRPDVVDKIADDLGLEGDAREPIWYKCVDSGKS